MARVRRNPLVAAATAASVLSLSRTMSCMTPYAFRAAGALRRQGRENDRKIETNKDRGKGRRKREKESMRKRARERIKEVNGRERKSESNREIVPDVHRGSEECPRKREGESACARAREMQEVADLACGPLEHEHRRAWGWRSMSSCGAHAKIRSRLLRLLTLGVTAGVCVLPICLSVCLYRGR